MPRGKYVNHKGRGRSFTSAEELAREERERKNKKKLKDEGEDDSDEEEEGAEGGTGTNAVDKTKKKDQEEASSSEEDSDEEEDEHRKAKGVEGLLVGQIENPNRRVVKPQKLKNLDSGDGSASGGAAAASSASASQGPPELSRREREAIDKQKAKERYQKLHAEGKTDEAQKDLARLAIIRKQREEAAAKRLAEQTEKLALKQTKQAETSKALGKKW